MRASRFLILFFAVINCQGSPTELRTEIDKFAAASLISIGPKPSGTGEPGLAWRQAAAKLDLIKRYGALIEATWKQARRNKASGALDQVEKYRLDSLEYAREVVADVSAIEAHMARLGVGSDQVKQLADYVQKTAKRYIELLEKRRFPEEAPNQIPEPTPDGVAHR